jgi:hypothetical protein
MSKEAVYQFVSRVDSDPEIGRALRGAAGICANDQWRRMAPA